MTRRNKETVQQVQNEGVENKEILNDGEVKVYPLDKVTLETIICDAITEHAESRTERYEVYSDRDKKKYKPKFTQVVRTYAYLAQIRRPDTTITIVDKYGEERLLNVKAFEVPEFLYDLINYSGRVYFCDEDRENENYITEATRKASDLSNEKLAQAILAPEDLLAFWRDYNSTIKHQVSLKPLTKPAVSINELAGIIKADDEVKEGYVFKKFTTNGSVSMTTVQARMIRFDALSECGARTEMLKTAQIVHRIATSTSNAAFVPEEADDKFVGGEVSK